MERPTLHTDRLVLLPLGPADLDEAAALYADPDVMRLVAGGTRGRAATAALLDQVAECWRVRGFGLWAIRDSTTGAFLGEGGLQPPTHPEALPPEVTTDFGFTFCRRSWGRGLATEAGEVMLRDAWTRVDEPTIHSVVSAENLGSQKVLGKLGFRLVSTVSCDDRLHQLWSIARLAARCG